jgi:hypothetical protein
MSASNVPRRTVIGYGPGTCCRDRLPEKIPPKFLIDLYFRIPMTGFYACNVEFLLTNYPRRAGGPAGRPFQSMGCHECFCRIDYDYRRYARPDFSTQDLLSHRSGRVRTILAHSSERPCYLRPAGHVRGVSPLRSVATLHSLPFSISFIWRIRQTLTSRTKKNLTRDTTYVRKYIMNVLRGDAKAGEMISNELDRDKQIVVELQETGKTGILKFRQGGTDWTSLPTVHPVHLVHLVHSVHAVPRFRTGSPCRFNAPTSGLKAEKTPNTSPTPYKASFPVLRHETGAP